jgi:tRNA(Ile)-lysidine synthase
MLVNQKEQYISNALSKSELKEFLDTFSESKKIIIAYSGGIDSSALLHLLFLIKEDLKQSLEAIHINHGLHEKSDDWEKFCKEECARFNVPFKAISIHENLPKNESVECWARNKRYLLISKEMNKDDLLLTAHHMDDQVETFFLQILRGAGPRGLASMPVIKRIASGYHVRPFLNIQQCELEQYAKANDLLWQDDESNSDIRYDRNYLRHKVLVYLEKAWPSFRKSILRVISHQKESMSLLSEIASEDMSKVLCKDFINLDIKILNKLSLPRQKNLIFYWLNRLNLEKPGSRHMNQIIKTLINTTSEKSPCVNWRNTEVRKYRNYLYASKKIKQHDRNEEIFWNTNLPLEIHGEKLIAKKTLGKGVLMSCTEGAKITIRYRNGGEKIYSNSLSNSKTVKQLFQEHGVLPWFRDRVPLVYINEELAVVPGFCVGKKFSASENEKSLDIYWSGYNKVLQ